jgi:prephenate dehydrogenase
VSRYAVAGLGLIGGSLALALHAQGWDRDPDARRRARAKGIDTVDSLEAALAGADVAFLAVPTGHTPALLSEAARARPEALFSDCASLKVPVVRAAEGLPDGVRFVGGHPMAGSHRRGVEGADPALFRGRPWALTPTARSDAAAERRISETVAALGALPVVVDAERHDAAMTRVSHLPHAVAAALATVAGALGREDAARLAGPGLKDATRLAESPMELILELAMADPRALADAIGEVGTELARLAEALRSGDATAVRAFFDRAADARRVIVPS